MTWPHRIAALDHWPAIVLTILFILLATKLISRRSKDGKVAAGFVIMWALAMALAGFIGWISHFAPGAKTQRVWNILFYMFYGYAAVLAVLSIPRLIGELRDAEMRIATAWRRPNLSRLVRRGRIEQLWDACTFCDRKLVRRTAFRTEWREDWSLSEQAVAAVASLGKLTGLFERLEKERAEHLTRILEFLDRRPAPNAAQALFWLVRQRRDHLRSAALRALLVQTDEELRRACDWDVLTAIVRGQNESDVWSALGVCRRVKDPRSAGVLVVAMASRWESVRWSAISELAEEGDRRALAPLLELLKDARWVPAVLEALCHVPDRRAVAPVVALLPSLPAPQVGVALALLDEIGDPSAAPAIVPLLQNPECASVAARVLARLNWKPATEAEAVRLRIANREWDECVALGPAAVGPLAAALIAPGADRVAIVEALGRIGDSRAAAPVCAIVTDDAAEDLIRAAAGALAALGDAGGAALVEMAANPRAQIRREALAVLKGQSPEAAVGVVRRLMAGDGPLSAEALDQAAALGAPAVPLLCEACRDAGEQRVASVLALAVRLGGAAALAETIQTKASSIPFLVETARSGAPEASAAALEVLKHMPPAALSRQLVNHLQQPARMRAGMLIDLLSHVAPQAANALLSLLQTSRDKEVLTVAAEVLARAADPRAAAAILGAVKKERLKLSDVRTALVRLGGAAVEGLCELLPAPGLEVIQILGEIRDPRAVEALKNALISDNEYRVAACADALQALGWRPANDAASAWYLAYKGRLEECRALGAVAVPALAFAIQCFESRPVNRHPGNQGLRDEAIAALGKTGDASALDVLVPLLREGARPQRKLAAESLLELAHTATFSEAQRVKLLAARDYAVHHADSRGSHTDHPRHYDKSTYVPSHDCHESSSSHEDNPNPVNYSRFADIKHQDLKGSHTDQGLGMQFPL